MNRTLALVLLIAVVLLVSTTIGEGGALDDIADRGGKPQAAADDGGSTTPGEGRTALAVASSTPWTKSGNTAHAGEAPVIGTFGDERELAPPAPPLASAGKSPSRPARQASRPSGSGTPEGALERHRLNIEE